MRNAKTNPGMNIVLVNRSLAARPVADLALVSNSAGMLQVTAAGSRSIGSPITSYVFNWGDDSTTTQTSPIATHEYTETGDYLVSVTVTNSDGLTDTALLTGEDVIDGVVEVLLAVDVIISAKTLWDIGFSTSPDALLTLARVIPDQTVANRYGAIFVRWTSGYSNAVSSGNTSQALIVFDVATDGALSLVSAASAVISTSTYTHDNRLIWYNAGVFYQRRTSGILVSTVARSTPSRSTIAAWNKTTDAVAFAGYTRNENYTFLGYRAYWEMEGDMSQFVSVSYRWGSNQNSQIVVQHDVNGGATSEVSLMTVDQSLGAEDGLGYHTNGPISSRDGSRVFNNRHHQMSDSSNLGGHIALYIPDVEFDRYSASHYETHYLNPSPYPAGTSGESDFFAYACGVNDNGDKIICNDEYDGVRMLSCDGSSISLVDTIVPSGLGGYGATQWTGAGTIATFIGFNRMSDEFHDYFMLSNVYDRVGVFQWPNTSPVLEFEFSDIFGELHDGTGFPHGGVVNDMMMDKLCLVDMTDRIQSGNVAGQLAIIDLATKL